jgi:hypothetical protein
MESVIFKEAREGQRGKNQGEVFRKARRMRQIERFLSVQSTLEIEMLTTGTALVFRLLSNRAEFCIIGETKVDFRVW